MNDVLKEQREREMPADLEKMPYVLAHVHACSRGNKQAVNADKSPKVKWCKRKINQSINQNVYENNIRDKFIR